MNKLDLNRSDFNSDLKTPALTTGISLIAMSVAAIFSYGIVFQNLIVPGDALATTRNLIEDRQLFDLGIAGFLFILILDIVISWSFYQFFKKINSRVSLLAAAFRLGYAAILGTAISALVLISILLHNPEDMQKFSEVGIPALILFLYRGFESIWSAGLIIFGMHLFLLAYLIFKTGFLGKIWWVLMGIAAIGYLMNLGKVVFPQHHNTMVMIDSIFMGPCFLGEVGFGVYLLLKSRNFDKKTSE